MSSDRERTGPRRRLVDRVTGRDTRDRVAALERAVRKLGEAQRDESSAVQARLDALARTQSLHARTKDVEEVLDAVRALSGHLDRMVEDQLAHGGAAEQHRLAERRLVKLLDSLAAGTDSIVIGPWTGEVGFELLYWIPFVQWVCWRWKLSPERCTVLSRGGVSGWYDLPGSRYVDIFSLVSPEQFRNGVNQHEHKQRRMGEFDQQLMTAAGVAAVQKTAHLHPELMYRMFMPYWRDEAGFSTVERFTRYRRLQPPVDPLVEKLPEDYVAVRFYFSDCFPDTEENRAFARATLAALSTRLPVVLLTPDLRLDDHDDFRPTAGERIFSITRGLTPERNLAVQSAVIARARAFVGTYGGYSYLAPFYGVPALGFYSVRSFKLHHLHAAQRVFERLGSPDVLAVDVANGPLVQLALSGLTSTAPL